MIAARRRTLGPAALLCVVFLSAYVLLGRAVSAVPPAGIDAAARAVTGEAPGIASMFTASCLWPVLTLYGIAGCVIAGFVPAWRARIVFSILTTIVTWQLSNVLKDVFERPRPSYWIVYHETTYAYSSGHAMFAVLVYWLWAVYIARSTLPAAIRVTAAILLGLWGAGVIWSRLALGAHYPSDLLGGVLLAGFMLAAATIVATLAAPRARIA